MNRVRLFQGDVLSVAAALPHQSVHTIITTTGWQPTCKCPHTEADLIPCTVLDPFSGAGTTGLVAAKLQRDYLGIELKPDYVEMSRQRLARELGELLAEVEVETP